MLDRSQYPQYQTMSNPLGAYSSMAPWGVTPQAQLPEKFSTDMGFNWGSNADAMDWTKGASSQLGTGGFNGAGLVPQTNLWDKMGTSDFWFGGIDDKGMKSNGAAGTALGVASGLMNGYMGMKNYGLAKETLANNKAQFERNFGAQAKITNSSLADRQDRRVADATLNGNAGSVRSTKDYMSQYGVA